MHMSVYQLVVESGIELFYVAGVILFFYYLIRFIFGFVKNQRAGSVDFGGDLDHAITKNAVEEMSMTTAAAIFKITLI